MSKRPITVTILSWLLIVTGAMGLIAHFGELTAQPFHSDVIWISVVRLLAIVAGAFMLRGANWARWLAIAWIAFRVVIGGLHSVPQALIHTVFLAVFAYLLFRSDARAYFRMENP
jgi:hypothetical protein